MKIISLLLLFISFQVFANNQASSQASSDLSNESERLSREASLRKEVATVGKSFKEIMNAGGSVAVAGGILTTIAGELLPEFDSISSTDLDRVHVNLSDSQRELMNRQLKSPKNTTIVVNAAIVTDPLSSQRLLRLDDRIKEQQALLKQYKKINADYLVEQTEIELRNLEIEKKRAIDFVNRNRLVVEMPQEKFWAKVSDIRYGTLAGEHIFAQRFLEQEDALRKAFAADRAYLIELRAGEKLSPKTNVPRSVFKTPHSRAVKLRVAGTNLALGGVAALGLGAILTHMTDVNLHDTTTPLSEVSSYNSSEAAN